jgi:hypothetical protein
MEISRKAFATILAVTILVSASVSIGIGAYFRHTHLNYRSTVGLDFTKWSIHSQVQILDGEGNEIINEWHAGVVTNTGDNQTLAWVFGDADYNVTAYMNNATYISIGNDTGTLAATVTVLPNEWHREAGTVEQEQQSQLNVSCQITGGEISGTQVADCIGLNWGSEDDSNNLWAYDTFTEVTGIDNTFTINIEFQISVSHS